MPSLSLVLLGGFQARTGDRPLSIPTRKSAALLGYLALRPDELHLRDKLASLLWGAFSPEEARHSLRQSLSSLRGALSAGHASVLKINRSGVVFDARRADVDVMRFNQLVSRDGPRSLKEAAALYRGELLDGLDVSEELFEEWLRTERARIRENVIRVLTRLVDHQTNSGLDGAAIQTALRLLALDPLREDLHRVVMLLYARQGRVGDAVRQYHTCTTILRQDLGLEPMKETQRVYYMIRSQGRSVVPSGPPSGVIPSALPGRQQR
jgi:DNA-binding SARP family transcriptional activator